MCCRALSRDTTENDVPPEIIVTLGPATFHPHIWPDLLAGGATGFRVPFAKETPDHQFSLAEALYSYKTDTTMPFNIIMDLPGSKPRTRNIEQLSFTHDQIVLLVGSVMPGCIHVPDGLLRLSL